MNNNDKKKKMGVPGSPLNYKRVGFKVPFKWKPRKKKILINYI